MSEEKNVIAEWLDELARNDAEDGVVQLPSKFWGVVGDESQEDDAWGIYGLKHEAIAARKALEASDWNADVIRQDTDAFRKHEAAMQALEQ